MSKPHDRNCTEDNPCAACKDVERYVGWVFSEGIVKAQAMVTEINKAKKNIERQLKNGSIK